MPCGQTTREPGTGTAPIADASMIVTDLDGTLLDHVTYSAAPARTALAAAAARQVPVILCSSKTLAEMRALVRVLGLAAAPLIVENGGAVWFPPQWHVPDAQHGPPPHTAGHVVRLGTPAETLAPLLAPLAAQVGTTLRGFSAMDDDEVARRTGLSLSRAGLARRRRYSEPFVCDDTAVDLAALDAAAQALGARVTRGGRFFHLTGAADKGTGVALVRQRSRHAGPALGLGDAPNDLPLLRAVDVAVIVPRRSGLVDSSLAAALPQARHAPAPGPVGWNAAVLEWLEGA